MAKISLLAFMVNIDMIANNCEPLDLVDKQNYRTFVATKVKYFEYGRHQNLSYCLEKPISSHRLSDTYCRQYC